MKKILALTDFSPNAAHAAKIALQLAQQFHTGVILYHTTQSIPVVPTFAGGGFVTETANMFAEECREKLSALKSEIASDETAAMLQTQYAEGNLGDNIKSILTNQDIELIVMGSPEGSSLDHLMTGSETRAVIKATDRPVLVVPANKDVTALNHIVLATDYREADLCALRYLSNWVNQTGARLDIVHIQTGDGAALLNAQQKQVFEFFLTNEGFKGIYCYDLRGPDVLNRLNRFCADKKVAVLAVINYHHGFFSRLFGSSQTFKALQHLQLPLFVFPGDFSDETICPM